MEQLKSGIYKITEINSKKCYIGSAKNIKYRITRHKYCLNKNKHYNCHLQYAWNKYGEESFSIEILEYCALNDLLIKEQYYMDLIKPSYNIRKIAESNLGLTHSEETKIKMRLNSNKGKKLSKEHIENIIKACKTRNRIVNDKMRQSAKENMIKYNKSEKHKKVASNMGKIYGPSNLKKAHEKIRKKFDLITPKIIELRNNGMLYKEIAIKLGISLITVQRKYNGKRYTNK